MHEYKVKLWYEGEGEDAPVIVTFATEEEAYEAAADQIADGGRAEWV